MKNGRKIKQVRKRWSENGLSLRMQNIEGQREEVKKNAEHLLKV